ncbi:hypothetical protein ZIOFF_016882 [Zingiber officinale]|uniref:Methyltransferase domain-containing protein n=1 Tax=Zingiber officinale TaxID=94328 RepID=A0A8J5LKW3_ZINOF|nr:hypothetical protein ZIOFF_016882 [Zingiber officinale]
MASRRCTYSCETMAQTLEWMNAIAEFIRPYRAILDAHVVNFFKERLWELVDEQWMDCLRKESVANLLKLPSSCTQDYWPASLKLFLYDLRSLVLPREQELLDKISPNLHVSSLSTVLSQGMNLKKKHEVEILSAVVSSIVHESGAGKIIDVGSGQGYLAQALSFHYQLPVIAIDASLHHANVTNARAERIKKHYSAKLCNIFPISNLFFTCHILSSEALTALSSASLRENNTKESAERSSTSDRGDCGIPEIDIAEGKSLSNLYGNSFLVLAGLHACGDLSVNMLRTFVDCKQVRAIVGVGCCYNLLSEDCLERAGGSCGFPISNAAKLSSLILGKNARDLACQSAERWRTLTEDAALQNFDVHAFRAAFQLVVFLYVKNFGLVVSSNVLFLCFSYVVFSNFAIDDIRGFSSELGKSSHNLASGCQDGQNSNKYFLFEEFCKSGLSRLGCVFSEDMDLLGIWNHAQSYSELIGPFWSLRAALGPLVETYILLDRLLFLQEQGNSIEASLFPIFNPTLSPRNMAIIARRK